MTKTKTTTTAPRFTGPGGDRDDWPESRDHLLSQPKQAPAPKVPQRIVITKRTG